MPLIVTPRQLIQRSELYSQLASLLGAGVALLQALEMIQHKPPSSSYRQPLGAIIASIQAGASFAESLASLGRWMPSFDLALIPKSKMFGRNKNPRLLGRYVSTVDGPAVADAMTQAGKWSPDEICVFLLGTVLAPASELAGAIADQRKKSRAKVTLIPVDARDWGAYIPNDAPEVAKSLLTRLKRGT